jgi:hypothetical protein
MTFREMGRVIDQLNFSRGKRRFIAIMGIGWGGGMFVGMTLIGWYRSSFKWSALWGHGWLPISLCIWLVGGYLFGLSMWRGLEKRVRSDSI